MLPATPANPATGGGGDLAGGTLYAGGHVPMIVVARHGARGRDRRDADQPLLAAADDRA